MLPCRLDFVSPECVQHKEATPECFEYYFTIGKLDVAAMLPLVNAPVDLENPCNTFTILEEYTDAHKSEPDQLVLCRLIGHGQYKLKSQYDIKKRRYIGNTTMDPELAFIQSNISSVKTDDLVLDPFVGTGGLLLPAAHFGAYVVGTEINYQIARAIGSLAYSRIYFLEYLWELHADLIFSTWLSLPKWLLLDWMICPDVEIVPGKSSRHDVEMRSDEESVLANFEQYGTQRHYLCGLLADASWHDLWARPLFDAIVTDPPYGIREKGRKIGKKPRKDHWTMPSSEHQCHFPEKQPYALEKTFTDLCDLAAKILLIGAKLSFWFPVVLESYSEACLPFHPALKLLANCEQRLSTKTSSMLETSIDRRLLVYQKVREPTAAEAAWFPANHYENGTFRDVTFSQKRVS
ncbi:hypothetical protein ANCCEY_12004 [Ancylostoma ceylanicum]|uniref:tRNA (guanine(10)-N(2))-methyltransferase TRMT11 n=1 Tax=Ancylostoma ceylanicum TaxID=53326 RepID=A0A0D6LAP0_9BILA|nr:hypothetical protein ANCCEY_12004 [Ancylostoma ceylanicum]